MSRCRGKPQELDVRIMECLSEGPKSSSQISSELDVEMSVLSGRMRSLKQSGHLMIAYTEYNKKNRNQVAFWAIKNDM